MNSLYWWCDWCSDFNSSLLEMTFSVILNIASVMSQSMISIKFMITVHKVPPASTCNTRTVRKGATFLQRMKWSACEYNGSQDFANVVFSASSDSQRWFATGGWPSKTKQLLVINRITLSARHCSCSSHCSSTFYPIMRNQNIWRNISCLGRYLFMLSPNVMQPLIQNAAHLFLSIQSSLGIERWQDHHSYGFAGL